VIVVIREPWFRLGVMSVVSGGARAPVGRDAAWLPGFVIAKFFCLIARDPKQFRLQLRSFYDGFFVPYNGVSYLMSFLKIFFEIAHLYNNEELF